MGSKMSLSAQASQQYQTGAYRAYIDKVANETRSLDTKVMPYMTKETGQAHNQFFETYKKML